MKLIKKKIPFTVQLLKAKTQQQLDALEQQFNQAILQYVEQLKSSEQQLQSTNELLVQSHSQIKKK